jgi:hypothetical protein
MKKLLVFFFAAVMLSACQTGQKPANVESGEPDLLSQADVTVFYFHGKQRCVTCLTVQEVTQQAMIERFANNKDVQFVEIDFSIPENEPLAEKYEIVFSSLIVATPESYVDITEQAFDLALSKPEVLKDLIEKEVKTLLN